MSGTGMEIDETTTFFGGWNQFKTVYKDALSQSEAPLNVGDEIDPIELVNLSTGGKVSLKSLQRSNVPLVLNFGSCTWPPFVGQLSAFGEMMKRFHGQADFIIVYIAEAHPNDEWKLGGKNQPDISQPKSIEERISAAKIVGQKVDYPVDIYVDQLDNKANRAFGAIPERLAIVMNNKVEWIGGDGPFNYSIEATAEQLKKLL